MSVEQFDCPECSIAAGVPRERAWDVFWMSSAERRALPRDVLVQHAAQRFLTVGTVDPTWTAVLTCGHAVPA